MKRSLLVLIIILTAVLGLFLRMQKYDVLPPYAETNDEWFYSWGGISWFRTGLPVGWSMFNSYPQRQMVKKWETEFPLVSPWLEKPPLYTFVQGAWMWYLGVKNIWDARLTTIRLIPIGLSFLTVMGTGILAAQVFSPAAGIIAALLYATTPSIVMANRLSLTENLLTPIAVFTLIFLIRDYRIYKWHFWQIMAVSFGCLAAVLTKQIGIALPVSIILLLAIRRQWWSALCVLGATLLGLGIYAFIGFVFGWQQFLNVQVEFKNYFIVLGLPELIASIFRFPTIGTKEHIFYDGTMLMGYLLFFTSFWWLLKKPHQIKETDRKKLSWQSIWHNLTAFHQPANWPELALLAFPWTFITLLVLTASGDGWSFYGWHVYPLFPYLIIFVAKILVDQRQNREFFIWLPLLLILGSSAIRFVLLFQPKSTQVLWPNIFYGLFGLVLGLSMFNRWPKLQKLMMIILFGLFIIINIYTVFNLHLVYPTLAQPVNL